MVKDIKKDVRVSIRITPELDEGLKKLIEVKRKETGVMLTRNQVIESLLHEGVKKYLNK